MEKPEDYGIKLYTWNNGRLDVHQDVNLSDQSLLELPFNFGIIEGNFDCDNNQLTSLKGCPEVINWNFDCSYNQLSSLEYGPKKVKIDYFCHNNELVSLKGSPELINCNFGCSNNQLTSLEFGPKKVVGFYSCYYNKLTSLKGCPEVVIGEFYYDDELSLSLTDLLDYTIKYPEFYKNVYVVNNPDRQTTIDNLKKKISISNMVMGIR